MSVDIDITQVDQGKALSHALVSKEAFSSNPESPINNTNEDLGKRISQAVGEKRWREGLEEARTQEKSFGPVVTRGAVQEVIGRFGSKVSDTKDNEGLLILEGDEGKWQNTAKESANLAFDFLEKGYDGLEDPQKEKLRDKVEHHALQIPGMADRFAELGKDAKKDFFERVLREPANKEFLDSVLKELSERDLGQKALSEALQAFEEVDIQRREQGELQEETKNRIDFASKQLAQFRLDEKGDSGSKLKEIEDLQKQVPEAEVKIKALDEEAKDLEERRKKIEDERNKFYVNNVATNLIYSGDQDLTKLTARLDDIRKERIDHAKIINRLSALKKEESDLKEELDTLNRTRESQAIDRSKLEAQYRSLHRLLEDARSARKMQEEGYAHDMESVVARVIDRWFDNETSAMQQELVTQIEALKIQAVSEIEQTVLDSLQSMYVKKRGGNRLSRRLHRDSEWAIKQSTIRENTNALLEGGQNALVERMMKNTTSLKGKLYDDGEIKGFLSTDEGKKFANEATRQTLAWKIKTQGLGETARQTIANSTWGQELLQSALQRPEVGQKITKILEEKGLSDAQPEQKLSELMKDGSLWLLLLGLASVYEVFKSSIS